eukprot:12406334-Karenia_brevis.AAC.1
MADGSLEWICLEEARSKLLLSQCPKSAHGPKELAQRLDMWQRGDFEALLVRIEVQRVLRREQRQPEHAAAA